jgi:hypothetical protein
VGQTTDRAVTEIEDARRRLEADIRELEERLPAPIRSAKSVFGVLLGTAALGVLLRSRRSRRSDRAAPAAEVVVRIVREDRD